MKPIQHLGSWQENTRYKPKFILEMLNKYPEYSVVYTDADSEFLKYPMLFNLLEEKQIDIAAYLLDHSKYKRQKPPELLSGTIFFGNTAKSHQIVEQWRMVCNMFPEMWDQSALHRVIQDDFYHLPPEYCKIFDYMKDVIDPIIVHYQASRIARRREKKLN